MQEVQNFDHIKIQLASSERIREWSYGEVKKPETINYRTLRPERDGLFCERIFGTTKEWECYCGRFKSIRYKGLVCDRCGVEVTHFKVRRERMGHIELAAPVSHIWYYRALPSRIGLLLDLTLSALRSVLYYEKYITLDAGDTDLTSMQLLTEEEYIEARERYGMTFTAGMGGEAVRTLLEAVDLDALSHELRAEMMQKGAKSQSHLLKRIEIVENFRDSGNRPEWMIMNVIPVIPPELRPMVQLEGGRFATSDLNDLYRRLISRNNRLKRLMALNAPDIIIRNEKRMLQESVDALFDNSKRKYVVKGPSNRPLKSLSDIIQGKQGRFRQNLLGKRVDYSGRSVIVVGPELKLHQCGLPTKIALELFKPFLMKKLVEKEMVYNIKKAKTMVEKEAPEVWAILDEVVREHPVFLNRAPTLHRLGIQAFEPVLVRGKAIRIHPLVCHAYNADFDGDQMAIHLPLTHAAQIECWMLMLSSRNLLNPANGAPVVFPSLEIVLGIYYLTKERRGMEGEGRRFSSSHEVMMALEVRAISYQTVITLRVDGEIIETTAGRVIFNMEIPDEIGFVNRTLDDKELRDIIAHTFKHHGSAITVQLLESIKRMGFYYSTKFGATIGLEDIVVPKGKTAMIQVANKEVESIQHQYLEGHITNEERYNRVVEVWSKTNEDITNKMMEGLHEDMNGFNPVNMMALSGARGSRNQIRQLAGMRGLMAKPTGEIIELPIRSNFKEGLSVIEFFISTNGARKGLADTALKTANAGYLTRRLVDIAQDVVINEDDCGTINGIQISSLKDGEEIVETLSDRIRGHYTIERVLHPITGEVIAQVNEYITDEKAEFIEEIGIETIRIRTVLTCEAKRGLCRKCYGRNLATNRIVEIGEAVGIIAAQSIGQPGTQLTMRTFHIGGVATKTSEESRIFFRYPVLIRSFSGTFVILENGNKLFTRKGSVIVTKVFETHKITPKINLLISDGEQISKGQPIFKTGKEEICAQGNSYAAIRGKELLLVAQDQKVAIRNGAEVEVTENDVIAPNETIAMFDPFSDPIIAEYSGTVKFVDIVQGATLKEEVNADTGNVEKKITDVTSETLQPRIVIVNENNEELASYFLPGTAYLNVEDQEKIKEGRTLAKLLREGVKTADITGGLPRVGDLFEARCSSNLAVLAKVTGIVRFHSISKKKRIIMIDDKYGNSFRHEVPMGKYLLVRNEDMVEASEKLCEGNINPHDILQILGKNAMQQYLVNEIQEIYRLQGVNINDKHIGIIIRQMMRKLEIISVGDTMFIFGQQVDKYRFHEENRRVLREGGQPAVGRPLLLGMTRSSLNIDSFISAASFQETTRVLTNAAISGAVDELRGLKENVIIGHLIPAGSGIRSYQNVKLFDENRTDLDAHIQEIIAQKTRERELAEKLEESSEQKSVSKMDNLFKTVD